MIRQFGSRYKVSIAARLWLAAPLGLALLSGGCSLSYQFDSFLGSSDKTETTGSIGKKAEPEVVNLPPEHDLAVARKVAADALSRDAKDVSLPWENPSSGARGTVTPIASAYANQDGAVCRDFLASYVSGKSESWLRGEACRAGKGKTGAWEIRSIKPWTRS